MTPTNGIPIPGLSPPVEPVTQAAPSVAVPKPAVPHQRNNVREIIETVVFVAILVLMLRSFVAEAFVIPTGSMAETLLGYQKFVTCPDCGFTYPVNCTDEVEPQGGGRPRPVDACTCPNCRYHEIWRGANGAVRMPPSWASGDRVLVSKSPFHKFDRWEVVVFKFPETPQKDYVPQNYIKRLIGLPGETVAIFDGNLYRSKQPIEYPPDHYPQPPREEDRWSREYMYENAPPAIDAFRNGQFEILRKPPAQILSMRRIVYDNDFQSAQLAGVVPPRWQGDANWTPNDPKVPTEFRQQGDAAKESWLRYHHLAVEHDSRMKPHGPFVTDFIRNMTGYNTAEIFEQPQGFMPARGGNTEENKYWVGDLILECDVEVASPAKDELILELTKGSDRFQARFDLYSGRCRLVRVGPVSEAELATTDANLKDVSKFRVRFANVDDRLTVWVNDELVFGDGIDYIGDRRIEPNDSNDKEPASIGVIGRGRVTVRGIRLYRDSYYTGTVLGGGGHEPKVTTRFVQPGHYLCLGDNSTQSDDGRRWGLVPERLMLGQAKVVYFPFKPLGANRAGPIR